jgi:hypothetical protein
MVYGLQEQWDELGLLNNGLLNNGLLNNGLLNNGFFKYI